MYSQMTQKKASKGFFIKNKKLGMTNFRFYMEKHYAVTHLNVFKISNVEGPASCSFYLNPSQRYTKNLGLGKRSSHFTSSELFYSWSNEHLLILLSSLGSAIHPLLLLAFIVSKWIAIPSRKKELTFLVSWMYLLFPVLCVVFLCSCHREDTGFTKCVPSVQTWYCIVWTRQLSTVCLFTLALCLCLGMHF